MAAHRVIDGKRLFFCSARNKDRLRGCPVRSDRFRRLELAAPPSHAWPFRPPTGAVASAAIGGRARRHLGIAMGSTGRVGSRR